MQMDGRNRYSLERALALRQSSPEAIAKLQLDLLQAHLRQAQQTRFYREQFAGNGIDPTAITNFDQFRKLPFTCRADIDRDPSAFGVASPGLIRDIALTSGTTGEPVVVPYSEADLLRLAFNECVAYYSVGVRPDDRVLLTATLDRCFIAGLAYYQGVTLLGAEAIRSGPGQPARQWQIIEKLRPRILVGVPTFLVDVGRWGLANGIDVASCSIDTIITIGEPARRPDLVPNQLGLQLQEIWGARVYSSYGATEFETAFGECPAEAGGHVHPELMLVEIVDDVGNLLPDGAPGEVVVTPLGVEGFPLVRFRTGDVARLHGGPCKCGWSTKRLGPLEGRLAQRLKFKGTTMYPETIFHCLQEIAEVKHCYVEIRAAADGADDVTVVVGCDAACNAQSLEEKLQARLRVRPRVVMKTSGEVFAAMTADGGRKPKKFFDYRH